MTAPSPLIALCAGEASGDLLGAHLIEAIRSRCPQARFAGIGGARMAALGFESLYEQEKLAVRGFAEVVKRLPEILKIRKGLTADMLRLRPDVFVGIDAPDFNLHVEGRLKAAGIATVHYVSPSVWAWRRERVGQIVKQADRVLCLFPMEPQLYRDAGGRAEFVGHPMAQTLPLEADRAAARKRMKLDENIPVFALLPGSRVSEIDYMAPVFFQTARLVLQRLPAARFLLPVATHATRVRLLEILAREEYKNLPVQLMTTHTDLACTAADAVLVTSGTATLEVALCKRPMVISYKISPLTYAYVKRKIKVPHVGLPNILLGREAVPELLQGKAKPALLADALVKWYESPEEAAALADDFRGLHLMLKKDTAALAAQNVLEAAGVQA
ncbi:Lipid-A-disaccharide synthase [Kingella potus]|uniref:Lipid-A-disaccharide synthase n=1 Tax=Kingella potus TaxID=265175 RepID=A0A377R264_9NEIS|nr:lipid-A-disaccharide synthase [Kingella potus]STR02581.1 Lipid-A-disaccharide synthase [Kingella potus]